MPHGHRGGSGGSSGGKRDDRDGRSRVIDGEDVRRSQRPSSRRPEAFLSRDDPSGIQAGASTSRTSDRRTDSPPLPPGRGGAPPPRLGGQRDQLRAKCPPSSITTNPEDDQRVRARPRHEREMFRQETRPAQQLRDARGQTHRDEQSTRTQHQAPAPAPTPVLPRGTASGFTPQAAPPPAPAVSSRPAGRPSRVNQLRRGDNVVRQRQDPRDSPAGRQDNDGQRSTPPNGAGGSGGDGQPQAASGDRMPGPIAKGEVGAGARVDAGRSRTVTALREHDDGVPNTYPGRVLYSGESVRVIEQDPPVESKIPTSSTKSAGTVLGTAKMGHGFEKATWHWSNCRCIECMSERFK